VGVRLEASLAVLAGYLALGTALALWTRRYLPPKWAAREYYIAGGRMGGFLAAMTYAATTYSAFMVVGLVGFSYFTGVGAAGFELSYFTATMALLAWLARRTWLYSRKRGWVTPSGMLADLYGSRALGAFAAALYLVALIPYAAGQLKGIGEALAGLAPPGSQRLYYEAGVILALAVMLAWSLLAGMWSVAATDALQGLIMVAAAAGLLAWVYLKVVPAAGWDGVTRALDHAGLLGLKPHWPLAKFVTFITPWVFFAVTNPQVVQRLYIARDEKALRLMVRGFGFFGITYTVLVTLTGLLARAGVELGLVKASPSGVDSVTPSLLALMNPALTALIFTSIVAAAVSTADSILLTIASTSERDLVPGRESAARGVAAAVLVALAMAAVAWARVSYIVALAVTSSVLLLPLAPPTIASLALGRRLPSWTAWSSLVIGTGLNAALIAVGGPRGPLALAPYGIPAPLLVLIASSIPLAVPGALRGEPLKASRS
jgi:SSS family solute:Na+ symporter